MLQISIVINKDIIRQMIKNNCFKNLIAVVIFPLILLNLGSCIEEYVPRINGKDANKIFIFGQVQDVEGYQYVKISTTASINDPKDIPFSGCQVQIIDNKLNIYNLNEFKDGEYRVWIAKENLVVGTFFGLRVITPDGEVIVSGFDPMPQCPTVDSIYYERKNKPTQFPDSVIQGIQFYVDFDATGNFSNFYKWEIEETWEHHAALPVNYYWDGNQIINAHTDYSHFVCWTTKNVPELFIFSTEKLTQKKIRKQPIHFVDNTSQRLTYGYSILLQQVALNKDNYAFWEQIKLNNDIGGLYGRQPINISGNLRSETYPYKKILGIFQVVSIQTKRIFIKHVPYIDLTYPFCQLPDLRFSPTVKPPLPKRVMYFFGEGPFWEIDPACVLCNYFEGSTIKPDFWPY